MDLKETTESIVKIAEIILLLFGLLIIIMPFLDYSIAAKYFTSFFNVENPATLFAIFSGVFFISISYILKCYRYKIMLNEYLKKSDKR